MNWFISCMTKNYANFSGRARRKEYWLFTLFVAIFYLVLIILASLSETMASAMSLIEVIFLLVILIPNIAVTVRRLHDTDKSGWWYLISFIPFVGGIVLLVFMCINSTPGSNQYGDNPKGL
ncbi:DUF805 domain-containing protein [Gilliamella sp. B2969]|uniref:DUF805 domain-containing protein n=1 Tax=Gilliamella sp. B2969 TaxID=2818021 RepID=UPI00226AEFED|nr:DUF805 domain-containing protein [Gilliamella sp. B2969]MCX8731094.1 DUF805 domain-containing protein [Gilliamella sp. B2969]